MIFDHFVGFSTSSNDLKLAVHLPGRVQTGTKEIRPENSGWKIVTFLACGRNEDSNPCRAMEKSLAVAGAHYPPPYWSSSSALFTSTKSTTKDHKSLFCSLTGRGDASNSVEKYVNRIMPGTALVCSNPYCNPYLVQSLLSDTFCCLYLFHAKAGCRGTELCNTSRSASMEEILGVCSNQ